MKEDLRWLRTLLEYGREPGAVDVFLCRVISVKTERSNKPG
jgi:hypothetical protein